eukprot:TRINITY_DN3628_c0_g1_i7.p1 TRINITY_DN3628_c0_g1~~TRINITY_DN3628_c0_g1_i7.p1  ORF type:complete len:258 (-),score=-16.33 TRINITY_DN3628_c0_g1_i7:339-1112(-)
MQLNQVHIIQFRHSYKLSNTPKIQYCPCFCSCAKVHEVAVMIGYTRCSFQKRYCYRIFTAKTSITVLKLIFCLILLQQQIIKILNITYSVFMKLTTLVVTSSQRNLANITLRCCCCYIQLLCQQVYCSAMILRKQQRQVKGTQDRLQMGRVGLINMSFATLIKPNLNSLFKNQSLTINQHLNVKSLQVKKVSQFYLGCPGLSLVIFGMKVYQLFQPIKLKIILFHFFDYILFFQCFLFLLSIGGVCDFNQTLDFLIQ